MRRATGRLRRYAAGAAACGGALALTACGLQSGNIITNDVKPGSLGQGQPLKGVHLTVTSKEFSEQLVLGEVAGLALKAAGAEVNDKTNIQGSIGAREAVRQGVADVMFEYTGTAWITYQGHTKPVQDPEKQWQVVKEGDKKNGIAWLPPSTLNNTYAFAVNPVTEKKYHLKTTSDLVALMKKDPSKATVCMDPEFNSRNDGWPGVKKAYGMPVDGSKAKIMQSGLVYQQVAKQGVCTAGVVYTTDGRIPNLHLTVLEDDKRFFPNYDLAPVVYAKTLREHPEIAKVLEPIAAKLNNTVAQKLNGEVDVEGREPRQVAEDWLVSEGFIRR